MSCFQKTSNALRALSRLGSLGLGGGAAPGGGGGGLLGKMKGKQQAKTEDRLTPGESRRPPEVSMAGRRSPTLSGRRGPVQREPNRKCSTPNAPLHEHLILLVANYALIKNANDSRLKVIGMLKSSGEFPC